MEENNITDLLEISDIKLTESLSLGSRYKCIIIRSGITNSANAYADVDGKKVPVYKFYTESALREAVAKGIFENAPALLRSKKNTSRVMTPVLIKSSGHLLMLGGMTAQSKLKVY